MTVITTADLARTQALARELEGGRYIWGGCSPEGSDCSGFMSILINSLQGRTDVYVRRFATGNWPERYEAMGFVPGLGDDNDFSIGIAYPWELASGIGHVAGTLGTTNVESRGGYGVLVGPEARGATNSLFRHRFHMGIVEAEEMALDQDYFDKGFQNVIDALDYIINGRASQLPVDQRWHGSGRQTQPVSNNVSLSQLRRMMVGATNPAADDPSIRQRLIGLEETGGTAPVVVQLSDEQLAQLQSAITTKLGEMGLPQAVADQIAARMADAYRASANILVPTT